MFNLTICHSSCGLQPRVFKLFPKWWLVQLASSPSGGWYSLPLPQVVVGTAMAQHVVWQVEAATEAESGFGGSLWLDYSGSWARKIESAYQLVVEDPDRNPTVELWNNEAEEDWVKFEVSIRTLKQTNPFNNVQRRIRRAIITNSQ